MKRIGRLSGIGVAISLIAPVLASSAAYGAEFKALFDQIFTTRGGPCLEDERLTVNDLAR